MSAAFVLPSLLAAAAPDTYEQQRLTGHLTPSHEVESGLAFYRKYTEAILRRYVKMAMEAGRAPSLIGRELFRGNVTHCRVNAFDDVVIFVHDVERCLDTLSPELRHVLDHIALKEYTLLETSELLGIPPRTLIRRYRQALDAMTALFLERRILEPQRSCQVG